MKDYQSWYILNRFKHMIVICMKCSEFCCFKLVFIFRVQRFKMSCKVDLTDKKKFLIISVNAKIKLTKIAEMISRYHWTQLWSLLKALNISDVALIRISLGLNCVLLQKRTYFKKSTKEIKKKKHKLLGYKWSWEADH